MIAKWMLGLAVMSALSCRQASVPTRSTLFEQGATFDAFLAGAMQERTRWTRVAAGADVPPAYVERLRRTRAGLRLLIVAEDWCVDSANTVPFVVRLASAAGVETRIIDRAVGRDLLEAHRTSDGRIATPLVVVLRDDRLAAAWVERPAPLGALFQALATSAMSAERLADRQAWYDEDHGRSALSEILTLVEQTSAAR